MWHDVCYDIIAELLNTVSGMSVSDACCQTGSVHCNDPRSVTDAVRGWAVLLRCPATCELPMLTTDVLLYLLLQRSTESKLIRRWQSVCQLVGNLDWQGIYAYFYFFTFCFCYLLSFGFFHLFFHDLMVFFGDITRLQPEKIKYPKGWSSLGLNTDNLKTWAT